MAPRSGLLKRPLLLLAGVAYLCDGAQAQGTVEVGGVGVLPVYVVVIIAFIVAAMVGGMSYLLWRRHHGDGGGEIESARSPARFQEAGNWRKRFSQVIKDGPDDQFKEGTILHSLQESRLERQPSTRTPRKPGETLLDFSEPASPVPAERKPSTRRSITVKRELSRKVSSRSKPHVTKEREVSDDELRSIRPTAGGGDLGLGLGSGFSNLQLGSVVKIEDTKDLAAEIEEGLLFPTMRSGRSSTSYSQGADERVRSLARSGTRSSRRSHPRGDDQPPASSSSRRNSLLLAPPAADSMDILIPPPPHDSYLSPSRQHSLSRSASRHKSTRSSKSGREHSVHRASSTRRKEVARSDSDSDGDVPLGRSASSRYRKPQEASSSRADIHRSASSNSRSANRHGNSRPSGSASRKASTRSPLNKSPDADYDEDLTPLASVALQALQQNLGTTSSERKPSKSRHHRSRESDEENVPLGTLHQI
ncbi:hypothetical protein DFS34DRAFT_630146 [Phlyctochytrium arcticum]|nr:hypothetical protein DFS34DRAFT_630146 [Phlyctochytrium arcticum]